jgi:hypothetical protein
MTRHRLMGMAQVACAAIFCGRHRRAGSCGTAVRSVVRGWPDAAAQLYPRRKRRHRRRLLVHGGCALQDRDHQALAGGVPVRILVDPKANDTYPGNTPMLADFAAAGIPMRQRIATAPASSTGR